MCGEGNFSQPIKIARADELGDLAQQINTVGQEIAQKLDAKRALLLAISHELRSPLTRAQLNTELLPESGDTEEQRNALLRDLAALCFSRASETYHHWKIFCSGSSGICIKFNEEKLLDWAAKQPQMMAQTIEYRTLGEIRKIPPSLDVLPFTKRYAFRDEKEFRMVVKGRNPAERVLAIQFSLDLIEGLTVNPWVPRKVFKSTKTLLQKIPGCEHLTILYSTVFTSNEWVAAAAAAA